MVVGMLVLFDTATGAIIFSEETGALRLVIVKVYTIISQIGIILSLLRLYCQTEANKKIGEEECGGARGSQYTAFVEVL